MSPASPIPSPIDTIHFQITTYSFVQWNLSSMHLNVLFIAILALYLIIPFGTQVYGSTDQCDLPGNQSCPQTSSNSQAKSEAEPEIAQTQTPLILPDLSPTREDLNDDQTDESAKSSDSNDNDGATTSTSTVLMMVTLQKIMLTIIPMMSKKVVIAQKIMMGKILAMGVQ